MSATPPPGDAAGHPDPSYGFQVPPGYGLPPPPGGADAHDPLVPPPYGGLRPAWDRLVDLLRLGGTQVAWILVLTFALPQVAQAWLVSVLFEDVTSAGGGLVLPAGEAADPGTPVFPGLGLSVLLVAMFLVIAAMAAIGWGAGIWTITQLAAGLPVSTGSALGMGARRLVPMFGWYVLYTLLILIGGLFCLLPGLYVLVAGGLFSYAVMYERDRNPMVRSFVLVHRAFPLVLGRFSLLALLAIGVVCGLGVCVGGLGLLGGAGGQLAADVILALAVVPVYTVALVGALLTYTQARARSEPISTASLWAAMNVDAADGPPGYPGPVAST